MLVLNYVLYVSAKEMCRNGDLLRCTEAFEDYTVLTSICTWIPVL